MGNEDFPQKAPRSPLHPVVVHRVKITHCVLPSSRSPLVPTWHRGVQRRHPASPRHQPSCWALQGYSAQASRGRHAGTRAGRARRGITEAPPLRGGSARPSSREPSCRGGNFYSTAPCGDTALRRDGPTNLTTLAVLASAGLILPVKLEGPSSTGRRARATTSNRARSIRSVRRGEIQCARSRAGSAPPGGQSKLFAKATRRDQGPVGAPLYEVLLAARELSIHRKSARPGRSRAGRFERSAARCVGRGPAQVVRGVMQRSAVAAVPPRRG